MVNVREDDDFVRGIVGMNPGNVSIFSLSAGKKANLFLLQFLGYLNRGFSLHEEELTEFRGSMLRYLSTHSSLIVADLRYQAPGGLEEGIFPKRLPHLYRGETLSIFGHYATGTEEVILSLVGRDGQSKYRELLFRRRLSECPPAGRELAQQWGAQKVFHLIGQRTLSTDPQARSRYTDEIGTIAKQYSLYVPY
jgi:Ca-activated chloride channel family protein